LALLHRRAGQSVLHRRDDDVADARVPTARAAEHPDAKDLLRARVVGDLEPRLLLDHLLGLLQDLSDAPTLGLGYRPRLGDKHAVSDAAGVLLVVGGVLVRPSQDLAVEVVARRVADGDHHRLVHLVAHDHADAGLAPRALGAVAL